MDVVQAKIYRLKLFILFPVSFSARSPKPNVVLGLRSRSGHPNGAVPRGTSTLGIR